MITDRERFQLLFGRYLKILFLGLLFSSSLQALNKDIEIIVLDSETNEVIPHAIVQIQELSRTITCDKNGQYNSLKLEHGVYTFVLNHIGYFENVSTVVIDNYTNNILAFYLIPKNIELDPVIISDYNSYSKFDDLQELSNVLKGKELQKHLGLSIASTLKNEAGLAMRSMGPAPSRPVIRGLGSSRVLISEDGIKTSDLSATSPDHAVTIDPFSISRIEVLRGPKTLIQSSTTLGGIVNVIRDEIPTVLHDNISGQFGFFGETVNNGYLGSIILQAPLNPIAFRGEFSKRKTQDLNTPGGSLKNSDSENLNFSISSSYIDENGFIGASFRRFELDYGIPGGFVGAHPNGVNISIYKNQYNLKSEYELSNSGTEQINVDVSRVFYRHREFESSGALGAEFKIVDYIGDINLSHKKFGLFDNGILGLSLEFRDFDIGGFVFTSPSKSLNMSAYLYENYSLDRFSFEFGVRYDFNNISPDNEDRSSNIGFIREREFHNYSLSLSILYQQSEYVFFGTNLSKSSRVPTIEELYSEGPHLAAYSYEVGNPDLQSETGYGGEIFVYHQFEKLFFNFTLFGNKLNNYLIPRNTGDINYATFLPIYQTEGVNATLYGLESRIDWTIYKYLEFSNTVSYTIGEFANGGNLPQIPPFKGLTELKYKTEKLNFGISGEWAFEQNKVDEFELPTKGYFVANLFVQYSLVNSNNTSNFTLNIDNVFNTEYRNHLSRVKSILPEAGRNFRLSYKMYFHL